jgi:hypothetical protein
MTKIEKFVKEQFGIELTVYELELIAIIASGRVIPTDNPAGKENANKAVLAYLQDGLSTTEAGSEN